MFSQSPNKAKYDYVRYRFCIIVLPHKSCVDVVMELSEYFHHLLSVLSFTQIIIVVLIHGCVVIRHLLKGYRKIVDWVLVSVVVTFNGIMQELQGKKNCSPHTHAHTHIGQIQSALLAMTFKSSDCK